MNEFRALDQDEVLRTAAAVLGGATLRNVENLSGDERRNLILRAQAAPATGPERSIIIKVTRSTDYDASKPDILEKSGFAKEWAATAFLTRHAPGFQRGPSLLGGDARLGLLVFTDLGHEENSLVSPLLGGTPQETERSLTKYAKTIGRLHAQTAEHIANHEDVVRGIFPGARGTRKPQRAWYEDTAAKIKKLLGTSPPVEELHQVADRLDDPGPWRVLVHGDPCPDNVLMVGGNFNLIDFEFAAPGHALLDGIYWRMGFPTCWCAGRLPDSVLARVESAYRAELGTVIPAALDDESYRREIALIAAARLLRSLAWLLEPALAHDDEWGISTKRGRLLWHLDATIRMNEEAGTLAGFTATARSWHSDLRARWSDTAPLDFYPAFSKSEAPP